MASAILVEPTSLDERLKNQWFPSRGVNSRYRPSLRIVGPFVALLDDITAGAYQVESLLPQDYPRVREICDRYTDAKIGFVDAAVLAIVERLHEHKLATLDRRHTDALQLVAPLSDSFPLVSVDLVDALTRSAMIAPGDQPAPRVPPSGSRTSVFV